MSLEHPVTRGALFLVMLFLSAFMQSCKPQSNPERFTSSIEYAGVSIEIEFNLDDSWSVKETPKEVRYGNAELILRLESNIDIFDVLIDRDGGDFFQFVSTVPLKDETGYWEQVRDGITYEVRTSIKSFVITSSVLECHQSSLRLIIRGAKPMPDDELRQLLDSLSVTCG